MAKCLLNPETLSNTRDGHNSQTQLIMTDTCGDDCDSSGHRPHSLVRPGHPLRSGVPHVTADVEQAGVGREANRQPVDGDEVHEEVPDLHALPQADPGQLAAQHHVEVVGVHVGGDEKDDGDGGDQHQGDHEARDLQQHLAGRLGDLKLATNKVRRSEISNKQGTAI